VIINLKAWFWLILKNPKNGCVPNAAVMTPNRLKSMTIRIRWKTTMAQAARVAAG
jgi:hypothetical protein